MEKIGIFGGTFNPPHIGHLNIVSKFAEEFELSRVLIIPTFVPPHKESPDLAPADLRLAMCEATFEDPIYEVSRIEIDREGKSYTCDTLSALHELFEDAEFYFLCGDDMLLSLHTWSRPKEILKKCTIVASVRSDDYSIDNLKEYAKEYFPEELGAGKIQFLPITPLPLSSSEIREKVKNWVAIDSLVTPKTLEIIMSGGLYL